MVEKFCFSCLGAIGEDPGGLTCDSCDRSCHFACGTGLSNVSDRTFITYLKECVFRCPLCLIGEKNSLIHTVITINQLYNESKHTTEFNPLPALQDSDSGDDDESGASDVAPLHQNSDSGHESGKPKLAPPPQGTNTVSSDSLLTSDCSELFSTVAPQKERKRINKVKGMLHNLKHISRNVDTVVIHDSNGNGIAGRDIDGSGENIHVSAIGGLCVAATITGLNESTLRYPSIKRVVYALGTNDHFHAKDHPGEKVEYLRDLDKATKRVFDNSSIEFITPFRGIAGLSRAYLDSIRQAIRVSGLAWKIHTPPNMRSHLKAPQQIHLTVPGKKIYVNWLSKRFASNIPGSAAHTLQTSGIVTNSRSRARSVVGRSDATVVHQIPEPQSANSVAPSSLAKEIADALKQVMYSQRLDHLTQHNRLVAPPWALY